MDAAGHLAPGADVKLNDTFNSLQSMLDELTNGEEKDEESLQGLQAKLDSVVGELPAYLKGQLELEKREATSEAARKEPGSWSA